MSLDNLIQGKLGHIQTAAALEHYFVGGIGHFDDVITLGHIVQKVVKVHALVGKGSLGIRIDAPEEAFAAVFQFPDGQRDTGDNGRPLHSHRRTGDGIDIIRKILILRDTAVCNMLELAGHKIDDSGITHGNGFSGLLSSRCAG